MIPTLNPATLGGMPSLRDYVALAARNDFRGVEFSITDVSALARESSWEAVRGLFLEYAVAPAAFELPIEWRADEETFRDGLDKLHENAQAARELACTRAITWLPPAIDDNPHSYRLQAVRRLHRIAGVLGRYSIRLGLEWIGTRDRRHGEAADGRHPFIWNMPQALDLIDDVCAADDNLGLVVDSLHWHAADGTLGNLLTLSANQIVHVHISDAPKMAHASITEGDRLLPGEGVIDLRRFLEGLLHVGYQGFVAVEALADASTDIDREQAAGRAGQSLHRILADFHAWDDSMPAQWREAHKKKDAKQEALQQV